MKAIWNGKVIAESTNTINVEGNAYFPPEDIKKELFKPSSTSSVCAWKGTANYYSLEVDGQENKDAAWFYPKTKDLAKGIENRVAFWKGVEVVK